MIFAGEGLAAKNSKNAARGVKKYQNPEESSQKAANFSEMIRVLVAKNAKSVNLEGPVKVSCLESADSGTYLLVRVGSRVLPSAAGFDVGGDQFACFGLVVRSDEGHFKLNGRDYFGEARIYKDKAGNLSSVVELPLERYLVGLVATEMPPVWPLEALKAQTVAARTYALFQKKRVATVYANSIYDVEATVQDQVYSGTSRENKHVLRAVVETEGEVLQLNGNIFKTFFHSSCGGMTETAQNVWGEENFAPRVADKWCARSPHAAWRYSISKSDLAAKLRQAGYPAETVDSLTPERSPDNPRAVSVTIDTGAQTVYLHSNDFRRIVGYGNLKSTNFTAKVGVDRVNFEGHGFGHGVGLCQWGAKGMAEHGVFYRDILEFYYPGAAIAKMNTSYVK